MIRVSIFPNPMDQTGETVDVQGTHHEPGTHPTTYRKSFHRTAPVGECVDLVLKTLAADVGRAKVITAWENGIGD